MDQDLSQGRAVWRERLEFALDTVTQSYAQILFSRSRWVGIILILATALIPTHLVMGLAAVGLSAGIALWIGLRPDLIRSGLFGYNAMLLGLAGIHFFKPSVGMLLALTLAVAISVVLTAALHSALGNTFGLPVLTIPFLIVAYGLLGAAPGLGLEFALTLPPLGGVEPALPALVDGYLSALGALFFDPTPLAGAVVIAALIFNSRVGFLLTVIGYATVQIFISYLPGSADPNLAPVLIYNAVLVAYGLGGIFFVPGRSSFLFAIIGAASAVMITLGLRWVLVILYLPVLILPFNLAMIMLLYAMRQRIRDLHPKSVDFISGTPEQNLIYYRTRIARFSARYLIKIHAPFLGNWICTQGEDGEITHKGLWRHAADFEVEGFDGQLHSGEGARPEDYYCYRLPVLAPAAGTVVRVIDGIPDNEIGQVNLKDNWGNLVLIYLAPNFYALLAHLSPGTIKVVEGQAVRQGEELARCGSSGRAPTPHLHFQLQATPRIGAPTLPMELHDVVTREEGGPELHTSLTPTKGQVIRNLEPRLEIARLFEPKLGQRFALKAPHDAPEEIEADIDLLGGLTLRSGRATLFYDHQPSHYTIYDTLGDPNSHLRAVQMALGRVPFEGESGLKWRDYIPLQRTLNVAMGILYDFASPFLHRRGLEMLHGAEMTPEGLVITGESTRKGKDGVPVVSTYARVSKGGLQVVETTIRGKKLRVERADVASSA